MSHDKALYKSTDTYLLQQASKQVAGVQNFAKFKTLTVDYSAVTHYASETAGPIGLSYCLAHLYSCCRLLDMK